MFILFLFSSPQWQDHHNSVSQLLWARINGPEIRAGGYSDIPVGGNRSTHRKSTNFDRALAITLFT